MVYTLGVTGYSINKLNEQEAFFWKVVARDPALALRNNSCEVVQ